MLALHRSDRTAEALKVYRDTHALYADELGVQPGEALRELHNRILTGEPGRPFARERAARPGPVVPHARDTAEPPTLAGRDHELEVVHTAVHNLVGGTGSVIWIEGEMGIGKSAVLSAALARAQQASCQTVRGVADELGARFPLRMLLDCLGIDGQSTDDKRRSIWHALHDDRAGSSVISSGLPVFGAIDKIVGLIDEACARGPLAFATDDLQWADEASLEVWHRLCAITIRQPLLLIGAARPLPRRAEVTRLRRAAESARGAVLELGPLTGSAVDGMVGWLVGAPPGPRLREIASRAAGNPLYVREIADALLRDQAVEVVSGTAEIGASALDRVPESLVSAVVDRLEVLSADTREVLRWAALLGGEFTATDLATVAERPASTLVPSIEESFSAGVLHDTGNKLAFRHLVIRQALYEGMPLGLRIALHHQVAETLTATGAAATSVAEQVLAAGETSSWTIDWIIRAAPALTYQAPLVCVELLERALDACADADRRRATLSRQLSSVLFRIGRDEDAERHARTALALLSDPQQTAELRWILAYVPYRASQAESAIAELESALSDEKLPDVWRARLMSLLALVQRAGLGELDTAAECARQAIALGERAGDPFAVGQSLEVLWQVDAVRRDYTRAIEHLDQALAVIGADLDLTDLRLVVLDNRLFSLQCLDRLDEASSTLEFALDVAAGNNTPDASLQVTAAVHHFWLGDWAQATARLDHVLRDSRITGFGLREGGPVLLMHGVAALIAVHRNDGAGLTEHLHAGLNLPLTTPADRENCDFLIAARAMAAAREGNVHEAITLLATILDPKYAQMMLRHQWLPDLVRLCLVVENRTTALAATEACEAEAAVEPAPARALAAARRCRALLDGDVRVLRDVAAHYRSVGRRFELAQTLEDLVVVQCAFRQRDDSVVAEVECIYRDLGAQWDLSRMRTRLGDDWSAPGWRPIRS